MTAARGLSPPRAAATPSYPDTPASRSRLPAATARGVLQGYRNRYAVLRDAVQETEPTFREDLLAEIPVVELLTEPISTLADRWHSE